MRRCLVLPHTHMKEKISIVLVGVVTVCACAVFATTLVHAAFVSSTGEETVASQTPASPSSLPSSPSSLVPVRLTIPAINVDANVQSVGLGKTGNMAVPTNFTDVGWYRYGPLPGDMGSAVIDGHVDNGLSLDAVFKHLGDLVPGDDIYVATKDGEQKHFIVNDVETYPASDVPTQLLFDRDDAARLNLITCAGTWQESKKAYDERVVVYATLSNS